MALKSRLDSHAAATKTGFYGVPLVKFQLRYISHILFIALYCYILIIELATHNELEAMAPEIPRPSRSEICFFVWAICVMLDDLYISCVQTAVVRQPGYRCDH